MKSKKIKKKMKLTEKEQKKDKRTIIECKFFRDKKMITMQEKKKMQELKIRKMCKFQLKK